jgi:NDP-sugar pyrophosphorylase family protein
MSDVEDSVCTSLRVRDREVVGVVPAAGRSRRLGLLPCSKELFPLGFVTDAKGSQSRPKVAAEYLLDTFKAAGVTKAYLVIREAKWDIPAYFGDGHHVGMDLAYVVIPGSSGPPDSVDRAYPFIKEHIIAFGFPDILLEPVDIFGQLLDRLMVNSCELVLGLFPAGDECRSMDMIEYDSHGHVRAVFLKPETTHLQFAWACAVWTPEFTEFLHGFLRSDEMKKEAGFGGERQIDAQGDLPVGAVIQAAIRHGIRVDGVTFPAGTYIDIGTPGDLAKALRKFR